MAAAPMGAAWANRPRSFEPLNQESTMTLVRSIFLAIAFTFAAGTMAQAADPAPAPAAGEAPAGDKKEKKAKKGKKAEGGEEKKAEEKK
jgi:hypothetical protein